MLTMKITAPFGGWVSYMHVHVIISHSQLTFFSNAILGLITPDGVPIMMTNGVHIVLVVLFELLGVAGIVFTIICFVFNIVFRERK